MTSNPEWLEALVADKVWCQIPPKTNRYIHFSAGTVIEMSDGARFLVGHLMQGSGINNNEGGIYDLEDFMCHNHQGEVRTFSRYAKLHAGVPDPEWWPTREDEWWFIMPPR